MTGLTDSQQAYVQLAAALLGALSLASIPSTLAGQLPTWVPVALIFAGGVSQTLKEFAGSPKATQQGIMDTLRELAQTWSSMTPEQQQKFLADLPNLLSLLSALPKS